jgi:hypothetical protein
VIDAIIKYGKYASILTAYCFSVVGGAYFPSPSICRDRAWRLFLLLCFGIYFVIDFAVNRPIAQVMESGKILLAGMGPVLVVRENVFVFNFGIYEKVFVLLGQLIKSGWCEFLDGLRI